MPFARAVVSRARRVVMVRRVLTVVFMAASFLLELWLLWWFWI